MLVQKDPKVQEAQMKVQITNKIPYKELEDEALCSQGENQRLVRKYIC